jgi:hypothetical protein
MVRCNHRAGTRQATPPWIFLGTNFPLCRVRESVSVRKHNATKYYVNYLLHCDMRSLLKATG